jgi:hypothetical protein
VRRKKRRDDFFFFPFSRDREREGSSFCKEQKSYKEREGKAQFEDMGEKKIFLPWRNEIECRKTPRKKTTKIEQARKTSTQ